MYDTFTILEQEYILYETLTVSIADSFVKRNKMASSFGHGEARLYVGQNNSYITSFFNNFVDIKGVVYQHHLKSYLDDAKIEYQENTQEYRNDIQSLYYPNLNKIQEVNSLEYFSFYPANGKQDTSRFYIRSKDTIYDLLRIILIPSLSKISIVKAKKMQDNEGYFYIFRPFIEYSIDTRKEIEKILEYEQENFSTTIGSERTVIALARIGQGLYRNKLIKDIPYCIITQINDERLLNASHIKAWKDCNEKEKVDKYNGLILSPTFDRLFDRGLISFNYDGKVLVSPYLSTYNKDKLSMPNKVKIPNIDKREKYLAYHRKYVFKES